MEKIFNIGDIKNLNVGTIIGGTSEKLDLLSKKEIEELIGETIIILDNDNKKIEVDVKKVSISESMFYKKNIFLLISSLRKFQIGWEVFKMVR